MEKSTTPGFIFLRASLGPTYFAGAPGLGFSGGTSNSRMRSSTRSAPDGSRARAYALTRAPKVRSSGATPCLVIFSRTFSLSSTSPWLAQ